jgi:hypothetical protein
MKRRREGCTGEVRKEQGRYRKERYRRIQRTARMKREGYKGGDARKDYL